MREKFTAMPQLPSLKPSPSMLTKAVKATVKTTVKDAAQKLTGSRK